MRRATRSGSPFASVPDVAATRPGLLMTGLLLLPASLPAQEEPPRIFSDTIEVRVVNLEVVVTDRRGERVTGLKPEDFRLIVDGEDVAIEFFSEILDGRAVRGEDANEKTPPVPSLAAGSPAQTNYLVFIDDFFAIARDRNRVLKAMVEDLGRLGPRDRMAVVAFDGHRLELLHSWTGDAAELTQVFEAARRRRSHGLARLGELRANDQERRTLRGIPGAGRFGLGPVSRNFATRLADQVERSVLAAVTTLRSFAAPPGRRVMLLLSGGWPFSPVEYTLSSPTATFDELTAGILDSGIVGRSRLLEPLTDTANLLGYTLYPVDVPGLSRGFAGDASRSRPGSLSQVAGIAREEQLHSSLVFLAAQTGGRALLNSRRDESLLLVAEDTRSYYWLGFTPRRNEDNAHHAIQIEVLRPGLRVRAREGFVDLSRQAEVTMRVEGSLLLGDPPSTTPVELRFGKARRGGLGKVLVPLEVGIPLDNITLLPANDLWVGEVEIRVTVMDARGNRSETSLAKIPISGSRRPKAGERFWYETTLAMRRRDHKIVVAVYDPLSGALLSSSGEIARGQ